MIYDDIEIDMTTGEIYTGDKSWAEAFDLSDKQLSRMGFSAAELCIVLMTRKQREALRHRMLKSRPGKGVFYPMCHGVLTSVQQKRLGRIFAIMANRRHKKKIAQKTEDYIRMGLLKSTKVEK